MCSLSQLHDVGHMVGIYFLGNARITTLSVHYYLDGALFTLRRTDCLGQESPVFKGVNDFSHVAYLDDVIHVALKHSLDIVLMPFRFVIVTLDFNIMTCRLPVLLLWERMSQVLPLHINQDGEDLCIQWV